TRAEEDQGQQKNEKQGNHSYYLRDTVCPTGPHPCTRSYVFLIPTGGHEAGSTSRFSTFDSMTAARD
ncbi:hypothetical protein, partial [Streptomyces subrutilus]|uniref:hypothetical protein n=1 Tax=Streptomyces subrutilus TaxID=36818 RepID=UPI0033CF7890